jgi:hypothetical protein
LVGLLFGALGLGIGVGEGRDFGASVGQPGLALVPASQFARDGQSVLQGHGVGGRGLSEQLLDLEVDMLELRAGARVIDRVAPVGVGQDLGAVDGLT